MYSSPRIFDVLMVLAFIGFPFFLFFSFDASSVFDNHKNIFEVMFWISIEES